jgi:hypothetical protein
MVPMRDSRERQDGAGPFDAQVRIRGTARALPGMSMRVVRADRAPLPGGLAAAATSPKRTLAR